MVREQYKTLHVRIVLIMAAAAIIPLIILASINYFEFQSTFLRETQTPFRSMVSKTKSSFELLLAERSSMVSLIASLYSYEDLADEKTLRRIFLSMQREFSGFVDLGLIDERGKLVNYVGPYAKELACVDYSNEDWFHQVQVKNWFISEVFFGFRHVPHVVIAIQNTTLDGQSWIVRATLDTAQFTKLIVTMNLEPGSDAFLLNQEGILQTDSAFYGKTMEKIPFAMPAPSYDANVVQLKDNKGRTVLLAFSNIKDTNFVLMAVKSTENFFHNWLMVRTDLVLVFSVSALCIFFVAARTVGRLIQRLRRSDEDREKALLQMEHTEKLSSIGRLAAGVAHEINNPLAIINEKAGLLHDILEREQDFPRKAMFDSQLGAIRAAVQRCKDITHRMLGFARRMDVKIEVLNVNDMVRETLTFLAKEAAHRNVEIVQELDDTLPGVPCDRGQLQQVFLNVLINALDAVREGGKTVIRSFARDTENIAVSFTDNGSGMDEETRKHIFEPFFTTKGEGGTGLGMSIIYGIMKRHGGDIEVYSRPGEGTTVTIILPLRQTVAGG
ncbi:hypothetical protein LJC24_03925 [Desulfococcaceae bacterium OttesenSCG-928-F15]|nr:hypothetical protein [Desulfococcaceae bacterium OttesenSCG-928-F15]